MAIWQADFYKRPLKDEAGQQLWELLVCDTNSPDIYSCFCPQSQATVAWLVEQLKQISGGNLPEVIQVFRPQSLNLLQTAGKQLGVRVEAYRHPKKLQDLLLQRAKDYPQEKYYTGEKFAPLVIDRPPPEPAPLQGERWRFATLKAGDLVELFSDKPIPILQMPESHFPLNLNLPSTLPVPGVVIDAGRQSMRLAKWFQEVQPVALNYVAGAPDGLILEAGLIERWVIATFEDQEVATAGKIYEQRKQQSQGLHFLLVQPDDTGMTYTGFWLLRDA